MPSLQCLCNTVDRAYQGAFRALVRFNNFLERNTL